MAIWQWVKQSLQPQKITEPAPAYDAWSAAYDDQPGNLMLDLDEALTARFLGNTVIEGKVIADVGCGTGRHWQKLLSRAPLRVAGFDVSPGMLRRLQQKFPAAETRLLHGNRLEGLEDGSCDLVMSTLTVAHIADIADAWREWDRVLRPGGSVFITDYHPDALSKGGLRTFRHEGRTVAVRNHIHSLEKLQLLAGQLGWGECRFIERIIDDSVRDYYARQEALPLFEKFKGTPIIYALEVKKDHDPA